MHGATVPDYRHFNLVVCSLAYTLDAAIPWIDFTPSRSCVRRRTEKQSGLEESCS
jgi:hypothetical protein